MRTDRWKDDWKCEKNMCGYNQKDGEEVRKTAAEGECKKDRW